MTIPGSASWTPASQEPEVSTLPLGRYAAVVSPRYQTLPSSSCAYQSEVFSSSCPSCVATSVTTRAVMPSATVFVRSVTVTRSSCVCPSLTPR